MKLTFSFDGPAAAALIFSCTCTILRVSLYQSVIAIAKVVLSGDLLYGCGTNMHQLVISLTPHTASSLTYAFFL